MNQKIKKALEEEKMKRINSFILANQDE